MVSIDQVKQPNLLFSRQLKDDEWKTYQQTLTKAKAVLGKDRLALIAPIRSLPVDTNDVGWGNLLGAQHFLQFARKLGFDTVQADPSGKLPPNDVSPYMGSVFSYNPLQIDLHTLTTPGYGAVLSSEDIAPLVQVYQASPRGQNNRTYREDFQATFDNVLKKAFDTYQTKQPKALVDFVEAFKQKNNNWLVSDALYEVLATKIYQEPEFQKWQGENAELDKALFSSKTNPEKREARLAELKEAHAEDIAFYQFVQALASKQFVDARDQLKKKGLAVFGDRQIGFSYRDQWANQDLFLEGWYMGAPPERAYPVTQDWNFPVVNPELIFDQDGRVDLKKPGAQLLYRVFDKMFQDFRGVRIDHIIGLIDPWVYKPTPATGEITEDMKRQWPHGRLFSSPQVEALAKFSRVPKDAVAPMPGNPTEIDVKPEALTPGVLKKYAGLVNDIVIAAAKKNGLSQNDILFEDLGTLTNPVREVVTKSKFSGIRVNQFINLNDPNKCEHVGKLQKPHYWYALGSHDNGPIWQKPDAPETAVTARQLAQAKRLKNQVYAKQKTVQVKELTEHNRMVKGLFTEMFLSPAKKLQVFFPDVFGIAEWYNRPGSQNGPDTAIQDELWTMRIPKDYEKLYFKKVQQGQALNLPEQLADTMASKGKKFVKKHKKLYKSLTTLSNTLKAPEPNKKST